MNGVKSRKIKRMPQGSFAAETAHFFLSLIQFTDHNHILIDHQRLKPSNEKDKRKYLVHDLRNDSSVCQSYR